MYHQTQDGMGASNSASWLWISCECGGIIRNDIFLDTLPYKYPYFSLFVSNVLTTSPEVVHDRVAGTKFDYNFCNKQITHDEISVPLPLFPLQQHLISSTPSPAT